LCQKPDRKGGLLSQALDQEIGAPTLCLCASVWPRLALSRINCSTA